MLTSCPEVAAVGGALPGEHFLGSTSWGALPVERFLGSASWGAFPGEVLEGFLCPSFTLSFSSPSSEPQNKPLSTFAHLPWQLACIADQRHVVLTPGVGCALVLLWSSRATAPVPQVWGLLRTPAVLPVADTPPSLSGWSWAAGGLPATPWWRRTSAWPPWRPCSSRGPCSSQACLCLPLASGLRLLLCVSQPSSVGLPARLLQARTPKGALSHSHHRSLQHWAVSFPDKANESTGCYLWGRACEHKRPLSLRLMALPDRRVSPLVVFTTF